MIATFFLIEFLGMYFASQNTLVGLADLHQSVRSITQVRQLRQLLVTEQEFLRKAANNTLTEDELITFKSTAEQLNAFFLINLELAKNNSEVYNLIAEAQKTLRPIGELSQKIINGDKSVTVNTLILDQYILEAQDFLGKVQLVLADDSDQIFNRVYSARFVPLLVGLTLSVLFLVFVLWIGIILKNKINKPIRNLVDATRELANGNLSVRAEISEADEIGSLAHAFNVMATKLEENVMLRRKDAEDLLEAKEAAEAANLAKSAFLANMSHEIRTPLGAVLGFADLIVDPQVAPSEKADFVATVKRNGELLSNIINDILDLSKIEAGKMQIDTQEVALFEILADTKTLLSLQAKEKGIQLQVEIDEYMPNKIKTDPLRLRQILINIIGNAIKFTSRGTVHVQVLMSSTLHQKNLLTFVVKDTGSGIKSEQINKLFAPFSQADATTKRKFGGTGLGLILSKRFAKLLGGDVVLTTTKVDQGSTFTITIDPGTPFSVAEKFNSSQFVELQKENLRLDGVYVLLAEDSPDNQLLVTRLLKLAGAQVEVASNGQEASEKALQTHYDVILMDLQMPIMDGYEATARLRKAGYQGKIVALTAHALNEERERCLQSGFDDHISKPINRDLLIERVYLCSHPGQIK